jgi:hypothetical protein
MRILSSCQTTSMAHGAQVLGIDHDTPLLHSWIFAIGFNCDRHSPDFTPNSLGILPFIMLVFLAIQIANLRKRIPVSVDLWAPRVFRQNRRSLAPAIPCHAMPSWG